TLTGTLADAGEHGGTGELAGDTGNHLLNQDGLTHTCTTEEANLATLDVRGQQVDDLNAGLQDLGLTLELVECGWLAVDALLLGGAAETWLGQAVAQGVDDAARDAVADWRRGRLPGVLALCPADEAVGRGHGDGAHQVVPQVLCDLQGNGLRNCL